MTKIAQIHHTQHEQQRFHLKTNNVFLQKKTRRRQRRGAIPSMYTHLNQILELNQMQTQYQYRKYIQWCTNTNSTQKMIGNQATGQTIENRKAVSLKNQ